MVGQEEEVGDYVYPEIQGGQAFQLRGLSRGKREHFRSAQGVEEARVWEKLVALRR